MSYCGCTCSRLAQPLDGKVERAFVKQCLNNVGSNPKKLLRLQLTILDGTVSSSFLMELSVLVLQLSILDATALPALIIIMIRYHRDTIIIGIIGIMMRMVIIVSKLLLVF